jgi:hypothetical protein
MGERDSLCDLEKEFQPLPCRPSVSSVKLTGNPADADTTHRHAVRLTKVEPGKDLLCDQPIVEIEWAEEDALPFSLCISAVLPPPDCKVRFRQPTLGLSASM